MNYAPDSEPSSPASDRYPQQSDTVLQPPPPRFPLGHVSSANNTSFPTPVESTSTVRHRPNLSLTGRVPDGYQSNSSHSTPIGSDLKSPSSVRTIATPDYGPHMNTLKRSNSDERYYTESTGSYDSARLVHNVSISTYNSLQRQPNSSSFKSGQAQKSGFSDIRQQHPNSATSPAKYRPSSTPGYNGSLAQGGLPYSHGQMDFSNESYGLQQNLPPFNLPPPVYPSAPQHSVPNQQVGFPNAANQMAPVDTSMDAYGSNNMGNKYVDPNGKFPSMPSFEGDGFSRSPFAMADNFTAWLFDEPFPHSTSPGADRQGSMSVGASAFVEEYSMMSNGQSGVGGDAIIGQIGGTLPQQHPMAVNSILDPASLHAVLSEEKRKDIIHFIETQFTGPCVQRAEGTYNVWGSRL